MPSGLGTFMRRLRANRDVSLREAGKLAGLDHAYIHRLETGEKEAPSKDTLDRLISAYKPGRRELDMLEVLVQSPSADPRLVEAALDDPSVENWVFATAVNARFRGATRPDPKRLFDLIHETFQEFGDDG